MHLADHIRPLLRDHDCVIIPDFGGLVAEPVPAHLSAARQQLGPPAKQVAFNQALTRNDGLLVDALSQYLRITANQAREVLRHAVEDMHQDLRLSQRTELPGIGVFRQAPGRGLSFDYTGTDNLLAAAFGLPGLQVRPVLATDARLAREKRPALLQPAPRLRAATQRRFSRWLKGVGITVTATLVVGAGYLLSLNKGLLPATWGPEVSSPTTLATPPTGKKQTLMGALEPQQATLAHDGWNSPAEAAPTQEDAPVAPAESGSADLRSGAATATTNNTADNNTTEAWPDGGAEVPTVASVPAPKLEAAKAAKTPAGLLKAKTLRPAAVLPARKAVAVSPAKVRPAPGRKAVLVTPAPGAGTPTINHRLGRSYVIAGAFATLAKADKCRSALVHAGFTGAKVILPPPGSKHFRVSAIDYADVASARMTAAKMRAKAAKVQAKKNTQAKIPFDVYTY